MLCEDWRLEREIPHLGHIGSAVGLQFGDEDPHDVENEDQIDLEIFLSAKLANLVLDLTDSVGHQHGGGDEVEKVRRLGPARPAGVRRGDVQLGGAVGGAGPGLGGHLSLHGDGPDADEHHRHDCVVLFCQINSDKN